MDEPERSKSELLVTIINMNVWDVFLWFSYKNIDKNEQTHKYSHFFRIFLVVSSMSSMCEEFPPHDLCAHHCIPVPGSYKCECSPGYVLMSDGHSCEKVG